VIAASPGAYGVDTVGLARADSELIDLFKFRALHARVALFLFQDDYVEFGIKPRGPQIAEWAESRSLPVLLIDRPDGFRGHFSSSSGRFIRRFVECIENFLLTTYAQFSEGCATAPYAIGGNLRRRFSDTRYLPPGSIESTHSENTWFGDDPSGAYWLIKVEEVESESALVRIGFSPSPNLVPSHVDSASWVRTFRCARQIQRATLRCNVDSSVLDFHFRKDGSLGVDLDDGQDAWQFVLSKDG
jgi:hypothetical protein